MVPCCLHFDTRVTMQNGAWVSHQLFHIAHEDKDGYANDSTQMETPFASRVAT